MSYYYDKGAVYHNPKTGEYLEVATRHILRETTFREIPNPEQTELFHEEIALVIDPQNNGATREIRIKDLDSNHRALEVYQLSTMRTKPSPNACFQQPRTLDIYHSCRTPTYRLGEGKVESLGFVKVDSPPPQEALQAKIEVLDEQSKHTQAFVRTTFANKVLKAYNAKNETL